MPLSLPFAAALRARSPTTIVTYTNGAARPSLPTGGPFRRMGQDLATEPSFQRKLRHILVATAISLPVALAPEMSSAEGLLDFFFGGSQKQQPQSSFFDKVFNANLQ